MNDKTTPRRMKGPEPYDYEHDECPSCCEQGCLPVEPRTPKQEMTDSERIKGAHIMQSIRATPPHAAAHEGIKLVTIEEAWRVIADKLTENESWRDAFVKRLAHTIIVAEQERDQLKAELTGAHELVRLANEEMEAEHKAHEKTKADLAAAREREAKLEEALKLTRCECVLANPTEGLRGYVCRRCAALAATKEAQ